MCGLGIRPEQIECRDKFRFIFSAIVSQWSQNDYRIAIFGSVPDSNQLANYNKIVNLLKDSMAVVTLEEERINIKDLALVCFKNELISHVDYLKV